MGVEGTRAMFGRRDGDSDPITLLRPGSPVQAHGLHNGIEALTRGEADAEWLLIGLNQRIQRSQFPARRPDLSLHARQPVPADHFRPG